MDVAPPTQGSPLDVMGIAARMFERLLLELEARGVLVDPDRSPVELIADTLAQRLVDVMAPHPQIGRDGPVPPDRTVAGPALDDVETQLQLLDQLLERSAALAAAVGACDCWGERIDCDMCGGAGTPGWVVPDRRLFGQFVYPAVSAIKRLGPPVPPRPRTSRPRQGRSEGDQDDQLAG